MIKGCQKKIIHLKNTGSPYFEEAYFILKESKTLPAENDMIKEALKIAKASQPKKKEFSSFFKNAIPALIGAAAASFLFGIILFFAAI